jgi:hypothetical protein
LVPREVAKIRRDGAGRSPELVKPMRSQALPIQQPQQQIKQTRGVALDLP